MLSIHMFLTHACGHPLHIQKFNFPTPWKIITSTTFPNFKVSKRGLGLNRKEKMMKMNNLLIQRSLSKLEVFLVQILWKTWCPLRKLRKLKNVKETLKNSPLMAKKDQDQLKTMLSKANFLDDSRQQIEILIQTH